MRVGRRAVGVADPTVNYHQPYHPRGDARRFAVAAGLIVLGSTFVFGQTSATKSPVASGQLFVRGTWGTGFRLPTLVPLFNAPRRLESPAYRHARLLHSHEVADLDGRKCESGPEKSKTDSCGFVYSPKAISGLSINADYYFGEIKGLVGEGAQYILNVNAADQGAGFVRGNPATINPNAPFAALITPAASGSVQSVACTNFNLSSGQTTGEDYAVTYVWSGHQSGMFTRWADWNTVLTWDLTPVPGSPSQSNVGSYVDTSNNAISPGSVPKQKG